MTRLLISTALAGLLALSTAAQAQGDDHRRPENGRAPEAGHAQPAPARAARPAPPPQAARPAPQAARQAPPSAAPAMDRRGGRTDQQPPPQAQAQPARQDRGNAMRGPDNGQRGPDVRDQGNAMRARNNNAMRGPAPSTAMRAQPGNRPNGRDFSAYHRNFSAPQHYRAQVSYRRPNGWYAHRWTFGEILPSLFWAQDYWLSDYYDFGLIPPPPGTVWVRDGQDALLIDRYSGEIIQVEYSVFY